MQISHILENSESHAEIMPAYVIKQAADWLSRIQEKPLTQLEQQDLLRWRSQSQQHEQAWQRAEKLLGTFHHVPASIGMSVLGRPQSADRRAILKSFAILLIAAPTGYTAYQKLPWYTWTADYQTAKGEQRTIQLADGGKLIANTDSAIDIDYNEHERLVRLYQGEIYIETASDVENRPFIVETEHGRLHALGTKFVVRKQEYNSYLAVIEHAVEILPKQSSTARMIVNAGQETTFNNIAIAPQQTVNDNATSWLDGVFYADNLPLADFIAILSRYRSGLLRCDAPTAEIRISGAFQLNQPDKVLEILQQTRPIRIDWRTRYWGTIYQKS